MGSRVQPAAHQLCPAVLNTVEVQVHIINLLDWQFAWRPDRQAGYGAAPCFFEELPSKVFKSLNVGGLSAR